MRPSTACRLVCTAILTPAAAAAALHVCRYVVRDLLGQGTFGQVFKCVCADDTDGEESSAIAIKVGAVVLLVSGAKQLQVVWPSGGAAAFPLR